MTLSRHLDQGRLLYFSQQPDAISVSENDHLRWMAFDDIVQSVVRKYRPQQLTLPHQWALMMPLLTFTPTTITELGLGAGNHLLFIQSLTQKLRGKKIDHHVIEANEKVIELAIKYFHLTAYKANIIHQDANYWLNQQLSFHSKKLSDWIIFDIYQKARFGDKSYNQLLSQTINELPSGHILSINFPESTEQEIKYWLIQLAKKHLHVINLYTVPQYKNQVIHLIPKQPNDSIYRCAALTQRQQKYWRAYQLKFGLTTA